MSKQIGLLGALVVSAACGIVLAQTPPAATPPAPAAGPTPAERAIEYRQAVYKVVAGNFGPLAQVAQGKAEFKADVARRQATRLAQIATFVGDSYPDISKEGKTRALPVIWTNRAEFDQLVADFGAHTKKLAEVVEKGEAGADFQAAVTAVGGDCKTCHEKFRAK